MKKYSEVIVVVLWFIMLLVLAIFMTSCNNTENRMSIDDGDSIVQCVVDSTWSSGCLLYTSPSPRDRG